MPATRLTMRKIREVLRLKFDCRLTKRQIAKSCAIARSTVAEGRAAGRPCIYAF